MQSWTGFGTLVLVALLAGSTAEVQNPPAARAEPKLVLVPVTVKTAEGEFLNELRREEFRILEDEVEQTIELFSTEPRPLKAVVLIDNALRPRQAELVQQSLGAIAGGFGPFDQVALATFEFFFRQESEFLSDNDQLYERLRALKLSAEASERGGSQAHPPRVDTTPAAGPPPRRIGVLGRDGKNLHDALYEAARLLHEPAAEQRKIILVITDGTISRANQRPFEHVLRELLYLGVTVYAVGIPLGFLRGRAETLEQYATRTGGEVFYAETRAQLESAYSRMTEQARYAYTLGYIPRNTDRARDYHTIEVRVRRPNLIVRAREGYFLSGAPERSGP
ncbi:MAG: VWA domain-containing protein [Firmicutes bacterium]|nr:VWA domain-containing protein [Bacillota bacterium]